MDDIEFDKIQDDIIVNPGLLLPLAEADVTVGYLFDEVKNCVSYYTDADGDECVQIYSRHDNLARYSMLEMLNLDALKLSQSISIPLAALAAAEPDANGVSTTSYTAQLPLGVGYIDIDELVCDYTISTYASYYGSNIELSVQIADNTTTLGNGNSNSQTTLDAAIACADGALPIRFTLSTTNASDLPYYSTLDVSFSIDRIKSVSGSAAPFIFRTSEYINITGLNDFKRLGGSMKFRNPEVSLHCDNNTPFDFTIMPEINTVDENAVALKVGSYTIEHQSADQQITLNNDNSNIGTFFKSIPDSLSYLCRATCQMPAGTSRITVTDTDSLFLGYSYRIPVEFSIDDQLDPDTVQISDIPDLDQVKRCKIICTTTNSLPLEAHLQLALRNSRTNQILTTVSIDDIISAPSVNEKGKSTDSKHYKTTVDLSNQQIKALGQADEMLVSVHVKSPQGKYVTIKTSDRLKFNIAIATELELKN